MGLFDKKEKKIRQELGKQITNYCKESIKELEELHHDVISGAEDVSMFAEEFDKFTASLDTNVNEEDKVKLNRLLKKAYKADKFSKNIARDIRDILRNQKKRLKEIQRDFQ